ncbi:hypothetical protein T310_9094, partial [Rasamsonia emersonii CBS 393.64]
EGGERGALRNEGPVTQKNWRQKKTSRINSDLGQQARALNGWAGCGMRVTHALSPTGQSALGELREKEVLDKAAAASTCPLRQHFGLDSGIVSSLLGRTASVTGYWIYKKPSSPCLRLFSRRGPCPARTNWPSFTSAETCLSPPF